ncbi:MAG: helix-turn-helix domain-containing protein [Thermoanaerobaculia bacterium]
MPQLKLRHVDDAASFGARLRQARQRAGMSQEHVAFPGCSPAYVSLLETGKRVPSLQIIRELARRLGVSEDFLAWGNEQDEAQAMLEDAGIALRLGTTERAQALYEDVLAGAPRGREQAEALEGLGRIASSRGDLPEAIGLLRAALAAGGWEPHDRPQLAEALGRALAAIGELAPAIEMFQACAARFRTEGDPALFVRFACLLGYALTDNGDFEHAEQVVAEALATGRAAADPYTRARLYWSQSRLLLEQGKSDLAEQYALRTIELLRVTEDSYALAHAYQSLAHIYLDLGRPGEAQDLLREGRPLLHAAGTPVEVAHYQIDEARALAALGDEEEAAALAMEATRKLGKAQPVDAGRAYVLLAQIFDRLGESARAKELYELAVELLEVHRPTRYLVEAYAGLSSLLKQEGDTEAALELLERAVGLQRRVGRLLRA